MCPAPAFGKDRLTGGNDMDLFGVAMIGQMQVKNHFIRSATNDSKATRETVLTSIGKSYLINIRFMSVAYCLPGIVMVTPSLQSTASPFPPAFRVTSSRR